MTSFIYYNNNKLCVNSFPFQIGIKEDGITQTMVVPEIKCEDSGEYKVTIANDAGVAESILNIDVSNGWSKN